MRNKRKAECQKKERGKRRIRINKFLPILDKTNRQLQYKTETIILSPYSTYLYEVLNVESTKNRSL